MIDILISDLSFHYQDDISVVQNTSKPELVLATTVSESVAMDKSLAGDMPKRKNVVDLVRKIICGQIHRYLASNILCIIHDDY